MNKNDETYPLKLQIDDDLNINYMIHLENLELIDAYLEKHGTFSEEQFINLCTLDTTNMKIDTHN